jgi:hypothetical protein
MLILAAAIWSMFLFSPAQSPTAFVALDTESQHVTAPEQVVQAAQATLENPQFIMIPNGICKDTDRGRNYPVIGTASASGTEATDACAVRIRSNDYQPQGTCAGELCVLLEQYCAGDSIAEDPYHCGGGCKDGRCVG